MICTKKELILMPVAGPILHGGNLSPNLQARFCKLYLADFVGWTFWKYFDYNRVPGHRNWQIETAV